MSSTCTERPEMSVRRGQDAASGVFSSTASERGGGSTNSPPANHTAGGEDTLECSFWIDWGKGGHALFDDLEEAKRCAGEQDAPFRLRVADGDAGIIYVHGNGTKSTGGPFFRWRFDVNGLHFKLTKHTVALESMPNLVVEVGSLTLMAWEWDAVCDAINQVIGALGGTITDERVSRVDPALDLVGFDVRELVRAWVDGKVITRARHSEEWGTGVFRRGRKLTGIVVGASRIRFRAYDKLAELKQSGDDAKREVMRVKRWGGSVPSVASRFEFQLRGEALRSYGVKTRRDWREKREAVLRDLYERWLRFTSEDVNVRNPQRTPVAEWWTFARDRACTWARSIVKHVKRVTKSVEYVADTLRRQAMGCLQSIAAASRLEFTDADEVLTHCLDELHALLSDPCFDWRARWLSKVALLARSPGDVRAVLE